ncbi:MAG: heavy-metal-associated domain-containing protein [Bacteroidaceae bacterium]|nr:heavy-metal-associated domain-containing protein [Bacteroidaceae bacterium]
MRYIVLVAFVASMFGTVSLSAKDMKVLVVKTKTEMCSNGCENKIKKNVKTLSGVKKVVTDVDKNTVTITYDAEKIDNKQIIKSFKNISLDAVVVSEVSLKELKRVNKARSVDAQSGASALQ